MRDKTIKIGVVVGVVLLCLFGAYTLNQWQQQAHHRQIHVWGVENNCHVISIDQGWFDYGPFWTKSDDQKIYRVELRDRMERKRVAYFRIGPFHFQQEWYDEFSSKT